LISFFLVGCEAPQFKPVNIDFHPTVLTFTYDTSYKKLNNKNVFDQISKSLQLSTYSVPNKHQSGSTASSFVNIKGKEVYTVCATENSCLYEVRFINGELYKVTNNTYATTQSLKIPVTFIQKNNKLIVKVALNGKIDTISGHSAIYIPYSSYLSGQEITKVFNDMAKISPVIKVSRSYNGEFDVDADDNIVFGNFKRFMGPYKYDDGASKNIIGKKSAFKLNTPNGVVPLVIEVYPTRKGSVASYSFSLNYDLAPNGTNTFDEGLAAGLIRTIKNTAAR